MAASAIINWIGSPEYAKTDDELVIRCQAENTGDTSCYLRIILYDADTDEILYDYGKHGLVSPDSTLNPSPGFPIPKTVTMPDHDWNLIAKVWVDDREDPDDELTKTIINGAPPPTISNISWSPAGDFHKLPSGASLPGSTEDLYLIGTNPGAFADPGFSDGEALLRIGTDGAMFAVEEGDHFRFDNMEWWILNIICGPECDFVTLADENAEAAREPKLGDEIQFSCNVDWHGEDPDEVRWYYAKTPNRCFDENDVSWTPFADEQFPLHIFEDDTDTDIVFIKAWARNAAGEIGELGDTCEPVFNLWAPRVGFQEGWLIAAFMVFILPGLAEKTEYYGDLVFDGTPTTPSGGFSLLWSPAEFVHWIAEAAAGAAEDMLDIIFGTAAAEETSGYSILWTAAEFVAWLYKSIAAAVESILDLVFGED